MDYVDHPRYGREPRITGVNAILGAKSLVGSFTFWFFGKGMTLHWRLMFNPDTLIQGTGVQADMTKHGNTSSFVTHYFDEKQTCATCGRKFIFFAEEQKHWYEELGFNLSAACDECVECRKRSQGLRRRQRRYEELHAIERRTDDEHLEMAEVALELREAKVFGTHVVEKVRGALHLCSPECRESERFQAIRKRL